MSSTPLQAPTCPLCGGPNGCAAVAAGTFDVACWCTTVQFSPRLLALVPADKQRQACICRACAEAAPADPSPGDTGRRALVAAAALGLAGAALPGSGEAQTPVATSAPTSVPTPARPAMQDIRHVVFHTPGPNWLPGKTLFDQPGVREHVAHYRQLLQAGKLALGGPHVDARGGGMMVPAAGVTEQEITAFAAADPAVQSGVLRFDVRPWLIGMQG